MVSDSELQQIVAESKERNGRPFTTAKEVADTVGMTRQAIHRRLDKLHEKEMLRKYKAGQSAIWWVED